MPHVEKCAFCVCSGCRLQWSRVSRLCLAPGLTIRHDSVYPWSWMREVSPSHFIPFFSQHFARSFNSPRYTYRITLPTAEFFPHFSQRTCFILFSESSEAYSSLHPQIRLRYKPSVVECVYLLQIFSPFSPVSSCYYICFYCLGRLLSPKTGYF